MTHETSTQDLDGIYAFAIELGKAAGQMLLDGIERGRTGMQQVTSLEKESSVDIVTQTDEDIEDFIHKRIAATYPTHAFIGEETYAKGSSRDYLIDDRPTWVVDPLDGTVNYTHIFPMFCVSIGFVVDRKAVIGVISAPFVGQLFHSCQGRGAWLTSTASGTTRDMQLPLVRDPVPPLPANAPAGCIFSCEWGKDRRDSSEGNLARKVESFVNMATELGGRGGKGGMVHGVRSLGSATLDLAYVAMGAFDIWWEGGCWEWDVAAGIAILQEAGGLVTTANPPEDPETAVIEEVRLGSRLYLAIRPAGDSDAGETGRKAQERVVRETWKRVRHLNYGRPGA